MKKFLKKAALILSTSLLLLSFTPLITLALPANNVINTDFLIEAFDLELERTQITQEELTEIISQLPIEVPIEGYEEEFYLDGLNTRTVTVTETFRGMANVPMSILYIGWHGNYQYWGNLDAVIAVPTGGVISVTFRGTVTRVTGTILSEDESY